MTPFEHDLHPIYGAVPRHGDFVQPGDVLGLSVDAADVVVSPIPGWVTLSVVPDGQERILRVRISPSAPGQAQHTPA